MQSTKSIIDNVLAEHQDAFEALKEFERTKKLPKVAYKQRINLTIDGSVWRAFRRYCKENSMVSSQMVEKKMREVLSQQ